MSTNTDDAGKLVTNAPREITDEMVDAFDLGWQAAAAERERAGGERPAGFRRRAGLRAVFDLIDANTVDRAGIGEAAKIIAESHPGVVVHDPGRERVVTAMQLARAWFETKRTAAGLDRSWEALSDQMQTTFIEDAQSWLDAQDAVRRG